MLKPTSSFMQALGITTCRTSAGAVFGGLTQLTSNCTVDAEPQRSKQEEQNASTHEILQFILDCPAGTNSAGFLIVCFQAGPSGSWIANAPTPHPLDYHRNFIDSCTSRGSRVVPLIRPNCAVPIEEPGNPNSA